MPFFAIPFPSIDPVAVNFGPLPLRWYALAYIGGFVLGWAYLRFIAGRDAFWRQGQPRPSVNSIDDLLVYVAFGVIIGGRLGHVLIYDPGFYLSHPLEIFETWKGGMAFHGGFLGALTGMALFARRERLSMLTVMDLGAVVSPIGIFLGRLANFIRPEMWGRPADVPWAMVFPGAGDAPRHPSQLYEAGLEGLALGIALWIALRAGALVRPGLASGIFGVGYGLARTFCEFFREPDAAQEALGGGLTKGMVLSFPMILVGLILIVLSARRRETLA
ncbi:prolipoprotein diacylglyceryl transferase [Methylocystis heyeri]|uniref:Phosphatidylglycerol--prolipoprotein diacylglyceryl transferase n=1 Tax=Methylocystis heyeri TaxID=391905 RepID=A0A6B8KIU5_9HYPH|nr:prolipoprotein diacylglyceryl transferase [Methylocystis heyeri]QGM47409.1 prolipoprotein diacylglyceryl transferase [Methylocystis heyeri]